ncbi:MAG: hypothetical protein OEW32_15005 [Nitrospira sp.]|nr:hypothetical protein [Nitrospira sp.]
MDAIHEVEPTVQWAAQVIRLLSRQALTGTVTIRFRQGRVQGMSVNQELTPRQPRALVSCGRLELGMRIS